MSESKKRMFANQVIEDDHFLEMGPTPKALYFHLGMATDDDGFVKNPKRVIRDSGASKDDLSILVGRGFVIAFQDPPEEGPVLIRHHCVHNTLKNDRYHVTKFENEFKRVGLIGNVYYTAEEARFHSGSKLVPQLNSTELNSTQHSEAAFPTQITEENKQLLDRVEKALPQCNTDFLRNMKAILSLGKNLSKKRLETTLQILTECEQKERENQPRESEPTEFEKELSAMIREKYHSGNQ